MPKIKVGNSTNSEKYTGPGFRKSEDLVSTINDFLSSGVRMDLDAQKEVNKKLKEMIKVLKSRNRRSFLYDEKIKAYRILHLGNLSRDRHWIAFINGSNEKVTYRQM